MEEQKVVNAGKAKLSPAVRKQHAVSSEDMPAYEVPSLLQRFKTRILGTRTH